MAKAYPFLIQLYIATWEWNQVLLLASIPKSLGKKQIESNILSRTLPKRLFKKKKLENLKHLEVERSHPARVG